MPWQKVPLRLSCRPLQLLKSHNKVSLEPSLLQAKQPQLSQPFLRAKVLQPSDDCCGLLWPRFNRSMSALCWGLQSWTQDSQGGSHQSGAEGQNPLPLPAGHAAGDAAQGTVGLLGCQHTLPGHVQLFIHQHPQVLLRTAVLTPFSSQPVFVLGIAWPMCSTLHLALLNFWGSHRPPSPACPGPSGWHPFPPACRLHCTAWCRWQICWGCTRSHCPCHWQRC